MSIARVGLLILVTVSFGSTARGGAAPGSLRVDRDFDDVVLSWDAGTGPYAIFEGTDPDLLARPANYVTSTSSLSFTDPGAAADGVNSFYLVGDELECLGDSDCDDGDPCNAFERCDLDFGTCGPAPDLARTTVDRPDDLVGPQLHVTYVLAADATDEELDINGQLDAEVRAAQRWYQEQVGDCMRYDTFDGSLDATFLRITRSAEELASHPDFADKQIALELEAAGLDDPEKLYVVFYGGTMDNHDCGGAAAISGGGPAVQFLKRRDDESGTPVITCPYFGYIPGPDDNPRGHWSGVMTHETIHALGFVPWCAPDHYWPNPGHLRTITSDVMANDGTGYDVYTLDEPRDQYYGHDNAGCPDLQDSVVWHVALPNPDPIPGKTDHVDPIDIDCSQEPGTASIDGGQAATIRFVNMTAGPVQFYWLDQAGVRQPSELVPAYSDWCCGTTNEFHVYVATDADTGDCIGLYEMVPGDDRILLVE